MPRVLARRFVSTSLASKKHNIPEGYLSPPDFIFEYIESYNRSTINTGFDPKFIVLGAFYTDTRYIGIEMNDSYNKLRYCFGIPTNQDKLIAMHIANITFYSSSVLIENRGSQNLYYVIFG